jgi:hypothetical protein
MIFISEFHTLSNSKQPTSWVARRRSSLFNNELEH